MKIKCDNKKYGEQKILTGIDLSFDKYGIVFILGQSGSGKSTLLNIIGMLDPEFDGEISIDGKRIQKVEKTMGWYRSKTLGFVFQEYNLIGSLSVKENLMLSLELSGSEYNHEEYTGVMKKLGVLAIENRSVITLSGGEKQRIAIARALLRGSKIVLADEPTGNLDEINSDNIMAVLKEISKDRLISINGVSIYHFSLWHFIPVIILGCIITVISGLRETIKISKLSIVEAIRCKNI